MGSFNYSNLALKPEIRIDEIPDEEQLQQIIEDIKTGAQDNPRDYLENAKVPGGGE